MGWGQPTGTPERDLLEQIEANSTRALLLAERTARLLLTLTEGHDVYGPDLHQQITKGRLALLQALGTRG